MGLIHNDDTVGGGRGGGEREGEEGGKKEGGEKEGGEIGEGETDLDFGSSSTR